MDSKTLEFLLSPAGRAVLDELATGPLTPDTHLATAERLRARLEPGLAAAILEMALLRQRAATKFSRAGHMFFTRDGLEQATAEPVASHRAARFAHAGARLIADLGCGIGGDALSLAATGASVVAVDLDGCHVAITQANAAAYDVAGAVMPVRADLMQLSPLAVEAFFFDPARRTATGPRLAPGRRLHSVHEYRPPLSLIDAWRMRVPLGAVKVSPGIDYDEVPTDVEVEFVSFNGDVKEGVLWFGDFRTAGRRATLLPGGDSLTDGGDGAAEINSPREYLFEPDGAVIRAHLVGQLARRMDATLIDPQIAYLMGDKPVSTPFARGYRIEDHFPFQLKRLRQYLRQHDVGAVTIKKRGSPLDPDVLRQALRLRGSTHRIIFLTRVAGQPTVLIGQPIDALSD